MKFLKKANIALWLCLITGTACAGTMQVVLKVINIEVLQTQEKKGDEVFFAVTQYSSRGNSVESRVPVYPAHWLSKQLSNIKNVVLWEGAIKEGESVRLVLSLLEQDFAAWDVEDLLGSAELTLTNANGRLEKHWKIPTFERPQQEVEMLSGEPQRYIFKGSRSRYNISFQVEQK